MKAILLIDHGSKRSEANEMIHCMANLVQQLAGAGVIVRAAHMELAEPDVAQGFARCVDAGATEVIALPYMVSPGRHSIEHIPEMVASAARAFPDVRFSVTSAFGVHPRIAELILERTGIGPQAAATAAHAPMANGHCYHPSGEVGTCGDACPANHTAPHSLAAAR
jgi:sirohydrochlorin ferrochelatase